MGTDRAVFNSLRLKYRYIYIFSMEVIELVWQWGSLDQPWECVITVRVCSFLLVLWFPHNVQKHGYTIRIVYTKLSHGVNVFENLHLIHGEFSYIMPGVTGISSWPWPRDWMDRWMNWIVTYYKIASFTLITRNVIYILFHCRKPKRQDKYTLH